MNLIKKNINQILKKSNNLNLFYFTNCLYILKIFLLEYKYTFNIYLYYNLYNNLHNNLHNKIGCSYSNMNIYKN